LELFCDLELMLGFFCIMPMLERLKIWLNLPSPTNVLCVILLFQSSCANQIYNTSRLTPKIFTRIMCSMGIIPSWMKQSNMAVYIWAFDLNIGLENLSFWMVSIFIMMHYYCLKTSFCMLVIYVTF
jgi:hypothetical protein